MSIAVISRVLNSPEPKGAARLVLLVYADRCDDTGGSCFPSIADTARRAAMSRTQAQTHTHALIKGGFLEVVANANGGAPGATRHYRVCLGRLGTSTGPESRQEASATGPAIQREGPGNPSQTGPATRHDGPGNPGTNHPLPAKPIAQKRLDLAVGEDGASGPIGEGLAPSPRAEAPGGVDGDLWRAVCERPAFRKTPAALEALAGEVDKARAEGESLDALTRRLRVLLEPERQHLTRLPFDPSATTRSPAPKAAPQRQPHTFAKGAQHQTAAGKAAAPAPDKFAALAAQMKQ